MLHIPPTNCLLLTAKLEPYKKAYLLTKNINEFSGKSLEERTSRLTDRLTSLPVEERGQCMTMRQDEVLRQLQGINPNKAAGPDGIRPRFLKYCAEQLCSILCVIFNQSPVQSKVAPRWKTSCIACSKEVTR